MATTVSSKKKKLVESMSLSRNIFFYISTVFFEFVSIDFDKIGFFSYENLSLSDDIWQMMINRLKHDENSR